MRSVPTARRVTAVAALAAVVAVVAATVLALVRHPLVLAAAVACVGVGLAAAAYALTRTGPRRVLAVALALAAVAAPLVAVVVYGRLVQLLIVVGLLALAGTATRHALGRDVKSLKSGPTPGTAVGPAARPVLLMNPRSGGGKVDLGLDRDGPGAAARHAGPHAAPFDLRFTGPDGTEHASAHLILVSNDRYQLNRGDGFGSRRRIDAGALGIVAATLGSANDITRLVEVHAVGGRTRRPHGWLEWTGASFEVGSGRPVEVGLDGEALVLDLPLRFRTLPGRCGCGSRPCPRLLPGRGGAHPWLGDRDRLAPDGRRPAGDDRAVSRRTRITRPG